MQQLVDPFVIAIEHKHLPHVVLERAIENRSTTDAFNVEYGIMINIVFF